MTVLHKPRKSRLARGAEAQVPDSATWDELRIAASACRACPLYRNATQTVFGEGPRKARIVLIGEQPGDREDQEGRPFVGPAGKLLDRALAEAGLHRLECYVTNAVKHFKWEPRGKRRIHQKPNNMEVRACRPWWKAELKLISPEILICLGATAARAVFDREVGIMKERGAFLESEYGMKTLITVHPSSLLRIIDSVQRERDFKRFVRDLSLARE